MDKIVELQQDFVVLQEAWNKLSNQLQTLDNHVDIQTVESKMNKVKLDITDLRMSENSQTMRKQKLADAHKWMDSHYNKTFERLANE
ncbi:hypothetical protein QUF74_06865 [Candidatus Halobeggiatoa sp. HSG11]|nr:hypothetical protein [Candidatus Halobeggiatoa sp. HSG11]